MMGSRMLEPSIERRYDQELAAAKERHRAEIEELKGT